MIDVVEIGEAELQRLVDTRAAVSLRDPISVAGYVELRHRAEDMAWFLAFEDGLDVGGGHALVGWQCEPGIGTVEAWTAPAARGRGVGQGLYEALLDWTLARGCLAVDTHVMADDPTSLAWAERRGFRRIGEVPRADERSGAEAGTIRLRTMLSSPD